MNPESPQPFRVEMTSTAKQQLREIIGKAKKKGLKKNMIAAAARIHERLHIDHSTAGEALYDLGPPRINVRMIADKPLVAEYGVVTAAQLVLIRAFRSMINLDD